MKLDSLRLRFLASTAVLIAVVLPATAFFLTSYYRNAVEKAFDARLQLHMSNLIAASLQFEQQDTAPPSPSPSPGIDLGEPLFKRPFSGWYWQIRPVGQPEDKIVISDSLLDQRLEALPDGSRGDADAETDRRRGYLPGPEGQQLRVFERQIIFGEDDKGQGGELFLYTLAADAAELETEVASFRNLLLLALGVLGLGLLVFGFWQVRFGLRPLDDIRQSLNEIRAGHSKYVTGDYPREIEPLQRELNALLRSNRDIVERARTHVGNLAHALKTPISIIANEVDRARQSGGEASGFAERVEKQTTLMRDQVRHHLDRARMAAQSGVIGSATPVKPVVDGLARALLRIHKQRSVELLVQCPEGLTFGGEKQDLEEMLGNLLDNAFKWAVGKVELSIEADADRHPHLIIYVDDDGPGLPPEKRVQAVKRGQRLDENLPGSGLGLSIVADLSHLYDGSLRLDDSPLGGLRAVLTLPVENTSLR